MQNGGFMIMNNRVLKFLIYTLLISKGLFAQTGEGFEVIIDDNYHSNIADMIKYNSGVLITGYQRPLNTIYGGKTFIYKIDNYGDTTSYHYYAGNDSTVTSGDMIRLKNDHFLIFGCYGKIVWTNKQCNALMVLKIDSSLNILWRKNYPFPNNFWGPSYRVTLTEDSVIYMAGTYMIDGNSSLQRLFLMKFNTQGDT